MRLLDRSGSNSAVARSRRRPAAAAWPDLSGIVLLRMDDPGAAASVHLRPWAYERVGERAWAEVGRILARHGARMTISYTPGWVDDGRPARGELLVGGRAVDRVPGAIHPSPLVRYQGREAPSADCEAEFRGVLALRNAGLASVELHGFTHMHPDLERWIASANAFGDVRWYRELAPESGEALARLAPDRHPIARGSELFEAHFGGFPLALVCPGNAWSEQALAVAHSRGFELVAALDLAWREHGRFAWSNEVHSAQLDDPDPGRVIDGSPAMALMHDRDLALSGVEWLDRGLRSWSEAGARRFSDLRELAAVRGLTFEVSREWGGWLLEVSRDRGPALPRPFPVLLRLPGRLPRRIRAALACERLELELERLEDGLGRVLLPAGA